MKAYFEQPTIEELTDIILEQLRMDNRHKAEIRELRGEVELLHARIQQPDQSERIKNYCDVIQMLQNENVRLQKTVDDQQDAIVMMAEDSNAQSGFVDNLHGLIEHYAEQLSEFKEHEGL